MDPAGVTSSRWPELLLVLLVPVLAFLLASFPARNSDLWGHLAAGRLLVQRESASATAGAPGPAPRVEQAWIYNLLCYGLYSALGGGGLVLFKALLTAGLAIVLLPLSRTGRGWCVPAVCTALALLAMGPRLPLSPVVVSYVLLALTLWFLCGPGFGGATREAGLGRDEALFRGWRELLPPWPLVVLLVVWVNTDHWFVLGLLTVALVRLGQALDSRERKRDKTPSSILYPLSVVVPVVLLGVVCLLNPAHVHAFALPTGPLTSPFQRTALANLRLSPAGLAYFPLLGLGLLSFVLNLGHWSWQRFLPWLGLALWSALDVRVVPFFAVLAGPVLAWNLQEVWAQFQKAEGRKQKAGRGPLLAAFCLLPSAFWRRALLGGRVLTALLGLLLVLCAWPGWLQSPPFEPRRWAVDLPPALERGAAAVRRWHQEGQLGPDTRGLHLSADTVDVFAWFAPGDRGVRDQRLASAFRGERGAPAGWPERMRAAGINHVVLYNPEGGQLLTTLGGLLADPEHWPLLYFEGGLSIFGWRDPGQKAEGRRQKAEGRGALPSGIDLERLAFHPPPDRKAPSKIPEREPRARRWWEAFWRPAPRPSLDREEALLLLSYAEVLRRTAPPRHLAAWEASQVAGLVGASGGWGGLADLPGALLEADLRLVLFRPLVPQPGSGASALPGPDRVALALQQRYTMHQDDTPPALLYLAVRAARRALAVNPEDPEAYLVLGESYLRLLHGTRERAWGTRLPKLVQLRRAQASEALNQAVRLDPNLARAHLSLSGLYAEMGYLDLARDHLRTYLHLAHQAGPPPEASPEGYRERAAQMQTDYDRMNREVEAQENAYAVTSAGLPVLDRAVMALQKGLARKARDLLLESHLAAFGREGMRLELELLLRTGRARDVWEWTGPQQREALGPATYHWLRAQALAACGGYAPAEKECADFVQSLQLGPDGRKPVPFREVMALMIGQAILGERPGGGAGLPLLGGGPTGSGEGGRAGPRDGELARRLAVLAGNMRQEADSTVLRGLLALEEGEVDEARTAFEQTLALWKDEATAASGGGLDFNARVVAQDLLPRLKDSQR